MMNCAVSYCVRVNFQLMVIACLSHEMFFLGHDYWLVVMPCSHADSESVNYWDYYLEESFVL